MKTLFGFFTRNWGLKLVALALAIVIYHALKPQTHSRSNANDRTLIQKP